MFFFHINNFVLWLMRYGQELTDQVRLLQTQLTELHNRMRWTFESFRSIHFM